MRNRLKFIVIILIAYCEGRIWLSGTDLPHVDFNCASLRHKDDHWNFTNAELSVAEPIDACGELQGNYTGKVVFYVTFFDGVFRCPDSTKIRNIQNAGGMGALLQYTGLGFVAYEMRAEDLDGITIHGAEFLPPENFEQDAVEVIRNGSVLITMSPDVPSDYDRLMKGDIAVALFGVILGSYCFACVCIAQWKLFFFIRHRGWHLTAPVVILLLESVANSIRTISMIDPLGVSGIFPYRSSGALLTASLPWTLSSSLLLAFFWEETMQKCQVQAIPSISKFKWPAYILVALTFILEYTLSGTRLAYADIPGMFYITAALYIVVTIAVSVFYIVAGVRVLKVIRRGQAMLKLSSKTTKRRVNLRRITLVLSASGVSMLLAIIAYILFNITLELSAASFFVVVFVAALCNITTSLCNVLVFVRPRGNHISEASELSGAVESNSIRLSVEKVALP